ncbi:MAG: TIGR03089 family protein [Pedococcus sp.]
MPATPAEVLAAMLRSDPARPRVTFYEDSPGPTQGERIELSAKVFTNWVNKAANALQDEWDMAPGSRVRLALPPHWRSLYWALAVWSVGATVVLDDARADLVVTDDAEVAAASSVPTVLVTLAALARGASAPVPPGAMDEARELATYADQFSPWEEATPSDLALRDAGREAAYEDVVPQRDWARGVRVHTSETLLGSFLATTLTAWAADGSVVLSRGPEGPSGRAARLTSEGVTLEV